MNLKPRGSLRLDQDAATLMRLMPFKVRKLLLVASLYDAYLLEEDGRLTDLLMQAYRLRDLGYFPVVSRATDAEEALAMLERESFDLVVAMMRLGDIDPFTFGRRAKSLCPGTPVVLLAYDTPELERLIASLDRQAIDRIFLWRGDGKILVGIIQLMEDERNAASDTDQFGIPNLLIVEDDLHFTSVYLPELFEELWDQTTRLLDDEVSLAKRALRQRGRPRVHLAGTYEEGLAIYRRFAGNLLGVISDIHYPRGGKTDPRAGVDFARLVRSEQPTLPILLQTSEDGMEEIAAELNAGLLRKESPTLLADFRAGLQERFGFGDLLFRDEEGREVARVPNLDALSAVVESLPEETLCRYFQEGQLRRWLWARTEFSLAQRLEVEGFSTPDPVQLRRLIHQAIEEEQERSRRGSVVTYSRRFHPEHWHLAQIGGGSLGGKGRGLAFFDKVMAENLDPARWPGVKVGIPRTLILRTEVFEEFVRRNDLLQWALGETSDLRVANRFLQSELPPTLVGDIRDFIRQIRLPLAVRSSSLLEDALYQPFAGIYLTKMIPNNQPDLDTRFVNLTNAIKLVFASTFYRQAKSYIEATGHRAEEEQMAVIIQEVVGAPHNARFYPDFAGVARSWNYYPVGNATPADGVVNVALGLGKTVVDGGVSLRFCPATPSILPQLDGPWQRALAHSQRTFFAINMKPAYSQAYAEEDEFLLNLSLAEAELDGTLSWLGSTYSREDDRLLDGLRPGGPRAVTFAHLLKNEVFPLAPLVRELLSLAEEAMRCPVEMEFAATLDPEHALPATFGFLQVRPLVVADQLVTVELGPIELSQALCFSRQVLGNGILENLTDILYVQPGLFDPGQSPQTAAAVGRLNARLRAEQRPYLLVGPGRWGSSDPWLGIPVSWEQISEARAIVEASLPNLNVDPSQGSHFFQNITSLRIGYFTVPLRPSSQSGGPEHAFLDWEWLKEQEPQAQDGAVRWLRLSSPLRIEIDGRSGNGVIYKTSFRDVMGADLKSVPITSDSAGQGVPVRWRVG